MNPYSLDPSGQKSKRYLTWEYDYLIVFIAEMIKVLANSFLMAFTSDWKIESTIHGFRADLDASLHNIEAISNILFGDKKAGMEPMVHTEYPNPEFSIGVMQALFDDAMIWLDDLSFQIEKTTARLAEDSREDVITAQMWFRDVLMPIVNLANPTARIHERNFVRINKLKDESNYHFCHLFIGYYSIELQTEKKNKNIGEFDV